MIDCMSGPSELPNPTPPTTRDECLLVFDFDGDSVVDVFDFSVFLRLFSRSEQE